MDRPQFSMHSLFLSVSLFAIALGCLQFIWRSDDPRGAALLLWMWFISGATCGYIVGVLFDRAFYCAVLGGSAAVICLGLVRIVW